MTVGAFGIGLGQRRRVQQHDRHQVDGGRLREDRAGESALDQQGNPADMVDVRMADDQRIDRRRIEIEWRRVARLHRLAALDHAAVQEHGLPRRVDLVQGAGYFAGRTMEP